MKKNIIYILFLSYLLGSCNKGENVITNTNSNQIADWDTVIVTPHDYQYSNDSVFKILSWNVEHFIDSYDDPYIDNSRENSPPENMPQRLKLFVKALRMANADIVLLQEFESAKYLRQIASDSLSDMNYNFFADIPSHTWYMNVVVMSKFPLGLMYGYGTVTTPLPGYVSEQGSKETQSHINTRMMTVEVFPSEDYSFLLTGVHLKAGRTERDVAMRIGQLNLLNAQFNRFLKEYPNKNMILAGDLNATPESEELNLVQNNTSLLTKFIDPIHDSINSHPADNPSRRLDYILVNKNMIPETLFETVEVEYFFSNDSMRLISDHLPLTAIFRNSDL